MEMQQCPGAVFKRLVYYGISICLFLSVCKPTGPPALKQLFAPPLPTRLQNSVVPRCGWLTRLAVDVKVILTPPCIFYMKHH